VLCLSLCSCAQITRRRLACRILRKHIGLNYNFGLNNEYDIDSARVGNETRYINHAKGSKANATATSAPLLHNVCGLYLPIDYLEKLVFGDIRIAFYASKSKLSESGWRDLLD